MLTRQLFLEIFVDQRSARVIIISALAPGVIALILAVEGAAQPISSLLRDRGADVAIMILRSAFGLIAAARGIRD